MKNIIIIIIILISFLLSYSQDGFDVKDSSFSYSISHMDTLTIKTINCLKESICYNYYAMNSVKKLLKDKNSEINVKDQMTIYLSLKRKFQDQEELFFKMTGNKFSIAVCEDEIQ